jgi:serine/threonine protein phosphatase PrpC
MTIAHVGDSRAYHIDNGGEIRMLTRDHSLVRRLEEMGQITAEEAQIHPQRNVLYRALGQGEPFEPEIQSHRLPHNGYLLICSDGLWGVVGEQEISKIIKSDAPPQIMCQQMVNLANEAGGPDNISAILVRISDS